MEAPASAPSLASPFSFDHLPTDLVLLILSHAEFRPLILVLRLVCHRWNRVTPLAVTSIPRCYMSRIPDPVLMSFVNLAELASETRFFSPAARQFLQDRICTLITDESESMRAIEQFPKLSKLQLIVSTASALSRLTMCCSSLTSLKLMVATHPLVADPVNALRFPALRELKMIFYKGDGRLTEEFLAAHLSKLTKLSLRNIANVAPLVALGAPQLHTLRLCVPHKADLPPIVSWINSLSALRALSLSGKPLPLGLMPCTRHILLSYQVEEAVPHYPGRQSTTNSQTLAPLLAPCLRLGSIRGAIGDLSILFLQSMLGFRLRKINLNRRALDIADLRLVIDRCTGLRDLAMHLDGKGLPKEVLNWKLPHLRNLDLYQATSRTVTEAVLLLQSVVKAWPSLENLKVGTFNERSTKRSGNVDEIALAEELPLSLLESVLEEAERNGMKLLDFGAVTAGPRQQLLPLLKRRQWLVVQALMLDN